MRTYLKKSNGQLRATETAVQDVVRNMLAAIKANRDSAVKEYALKLDNWTADTFRVPDDQIRAVTRQLPESFKDDLGICYRNITDFAKRQRESLTEFETEIQPGITLGQKLVPLDSVGCYVPGGKYPLISAAIMTVGTARVAGVNHIIGCAPPRDKQGIYPHTLYSLHLAGADEIYCIGGVQALASMAFGCVGMNAVDMIIGPGNAYVAEAKRQLFGQVGIDLMAGPTEILIIADSSADPELVALDLLGQAEHGPDSPAWLITTSEKLGREVIAEVDRLLMKLPTREIAEVAWHNNGEVILVPTPDDAIALSDEYAPEHLELMTADNDRYLGKLRNYGSLFVGEESTVAYGDKGVGTNHTLPTSRAARYTGGLWVGKFIKTLTYQRLTAEASRKLGPVMSRICAAEGMLAHAMTCDARVLRYGEQKTLRATSGSGS
jgi:sulfopropanediol 3-dehydrogenase